MFACNSVNPDDAQMQCENADALHEGKHTNGEVEWEDQDLRSICHRFLHALEAAGLGQSVGSGGPLDDSYYESSFVLKDGREMKITFAPVFDYDSNDELLDKEAHL